MSVHGGLSGYLSVPLGAGAIRFQLHPSPSGTSNQHVISDSGPLSLVAKKSAFQWIGHVSSRRILSSVLS